MTHGIQSGTRLKNSTMHINDWHARYKQQASWTQSARNYLLDKINPSPGSAALELGCGTGAVSSEIRLTQSVRVYGIDIDPSALAFASSLDSDLRLAQADGYHLPFPDNIFTFCFCHYLLMWINNPIAVLEEMKRVIIPGGHVAVMAEPDYGGSVSYPDTLDTITMLQTKSLIKQGANPFTGRRISAYLHQAGLHDHVFSVMGGEWQGSKRTGNDLSSIDYQVINRDLDMIGENDSISIMYDLPEEGSVQFIPTFFALAIKHDY